MDAAALSAAAQLNSRSGAIARGTAAATNAISNTTKLSDTVGAFVIQSIVFYDDTNPTPVATTTDQEAVLVEVILAPRTTSIFLAPVLQTISSSAVAEQFTLEGTARAGIETIVCAAPPYMACNPAEGGGPNDDILDEANAGRLLLTKADPGGGTLAPANFGLLCPSSGNCGAATDFDVIRLVATVPYEPFFDNFLQSHGLTLITLSAAHEQTHIGD